MSKVTDKADELFNRFSKKTDDDAVAWFMARNYAESRGTQSLSEYEEDFWWDVECQCDDFLAAFLESANV